ncbi:MAG: hypothetical protein ING33_01240, partial [Rhodocyclaceae bacterium]|nr:hypothetical protein [Rhodocyclaceae bacterium]
MHSLAVSTTSSRLKSIVAALVLSTAVGASIAGFSADAKTFRWASQGDVLTMDPHAQNEGLNNSIADHIYEPLVSRNRQMALEPCLAVSWQIVNPTTTRFKLRDK